MKKGTKHLDHMHKYLLIGAVILALLVVAIASAANLRSRKSDAAGCGRQVPSFVFPASPQGNTVTATMLPEAVGDFTIELINNDLGPCGPATFSFTRDERQGLLITPMEPITLAPGESALTTIEVRAKNPGSIFTENPVRNPRTFVVSARHHKPNIPAQSVSGSITFTNPAGAVAPSLSVTNPTEGEVETGDFHATATITKPSDITITFKNQPPVECKNVTVCEMFKLHSFIPDGEYGPHVLRVTATPLDGSPAPEPVIRNFFYRTSTVRLTLAAAGPDGVFKEDSPVIVGAGQNATIKWEARNVQTCKLNGQDTTLTGTKSVGTVTTPQTHTLECTSPEGTKTKTLTVQPRGTAGGGTGTETSAPTISILAPRVSQVSGPVVIRAMATHANPITAMHIKLNGGAPIECSNTSLCTKTFSDTELPAGKYTVTVTAKAEGSETGQTSFSFTKTATREADCSWFNKVFNRCK